MTVSIILPAKNEPELNSFLIRLHEICESIPEPYEIIIAMGDKETLNKPIDWMPHQKTIKTYGDSLERSILAGFSHAKGEKLILTDSDGCHQIEKIPEIASKLDEYEMVAASRYLPGADSNLSSLRSFVSWCLNQWAHLLGSRLSDPMVGFMGVRKSVVDKVRFKPFTWKIPLEIELKANPKLYQFGAKIRKREAGKSSASAKIGLRIAWDIFWRY